MKKMISKLVSLVLILALVSAMCLGAAAVQNDDAECASFSSSGSKKDEEKPVGVFPLKLRNGAEMASMTAFLVKSGSNTYILTHAIVANFASEGWELTLLGTDGNNNLAYCVGVDPNFEMAYLIADGMANYEPLKLSHNRFSKSVTVGLGYVNSNFSEAKHVEFRSYDFDRFSQLSDLYYHEPNREVDLQWMGGPVLPGKTSDEVQGIVTAISDGSDKKHMGIITFEKLNLEPSLSINGFNPQAQAPQTQPEETQPAETQAQPEPQPEPEPEKKDNTLLIVLAVVAAGAGYYFYNNYKKKNQPETKAQETTIPVTKPMEPMAEPAGFNLTIRSAEGKVYRCDVTGKLTIGRNGHNTVCIASGNVSGSHCVLYYEGGKLYLMDQNSTNGTFFNERERLKPDHGYRVRKGMSFFLCTPANTFTIIEE